ncbi:hypothetical protein MCUN1_001413 [Malassezia cuniculi]|uniref:Uncharacterized protein n=1 Tax=Malassezia cuniculi TaxID=948313 RepID=A0AAF0J5J7_9BASI|nr:hypothetical protein MCUN1_001413 [Malassezia cuniculi]
MDDAQSEAGAPFSGTSEADTPRRMRRSEMHEQDISRILAQMRIRDRTPRTTRNADAKYSDPGPRVARVPPTPQGVLSRSQTAMSISTDATDAFASPSAAAHARRNRNRESADFGDEYVHASSRLRPRPSLRGLSSAARQHAPSTPRLARSQSMTYDPPESAHTHNFYQALDLFRQQATQQELDADLVSHMVDAAELAATLNYGLRRAIHGALDMQMANVLRMHESPAALDAELSELLKYSDDHIRRMTDVLIALSRRRMQSPKRSTSAMRHRSISRTNIPPSASKSDWREETPMSAREFTRAVPETPTHRGAVRAREAWSALRRAASIRGEATEHSRHDEEPSRPQSMRVESYSHGSFALDDSARIDEGVSPVISESSQLPHATDYTWPGASHRPSPVSAPYTQPPLGNWQNAFGQATEQLAYESGVDVD